MIHIPSILCTAGLALVAIAIAAKKFDDWNAIERAEKLLDEAMAALSVARRLGF